MNSLLFSRFSLTVAALSLLGWCAPQGYCQATAEKLTTAKQVLARYVEVTGGIEKYKEIQGIAQEGTMSLALAGVEGKMQMKYAGPNRLLLNVDLGGVGTESSGIYGDIGWADSTMTGTRLITGKELEQLQSQTEMRQYYDPESVYKEMEMVGETDVNGQACYALKLTRESGRVEQDFYSVETGLKLKSLMTADTPAGSFEVEVLYNDYQEFSGLKQPVETVQKLPNGLEIVIKTTKFEVNPKIDDSVFELPEKIQKMVEKQKK